MRKCPVCDLNLANLPETKHPIEDVLGEAREALGGVLQALIIARF
jgi:hypothetical protein